MDKLAEIIALLGNFILSLGMVLQKKNVGWIGYPDKKEASFKKARLGWLVGFVLMNLHPVFNFVALLWLPPNVVAAMIGTNVAFTSILAALLLGERLSKRRIAGVALCFASVAFLGLRGGEAVTTLVDGWLYFFGALPMGIGIAMAVFRRRFRSPAYATVIAAVAGALGGYMVLAMKAFQLSGASTVLAMLLTPYLYLYLAGGAGAFSLIQLAFRRGDVTAVSPADYGMQVLWPSLASFFVFGTSFDAAQAVGIGVILAAIVLIADGSASGGGRLSLPVTRKGDPGASSPKGP